MKLRIRDNSLRLRLSQTDLGLFEAEKKVEAKIEFPGGASMHYILLWSDKEEFAASFDGKSMIATVPHTVGKNWLAPTEVTIDHSVKSINNSNLRLLIEKDFQCLSERKDEDESDMFLNPNTHC